VKPSRNHSTPSYPRLTKGTNAQTKTKMLLQTQVQPNSQILFINLKMWYPRKVTEDNGAPCPKGALRKDESKYPPFSLTSSNLRNMDCCVSR